MAQEFSDLGTQAFEAGVQLYLLHSYPFLSLEEMREELKNGDENSSNKALKFAFEFFKIAAYTGNLYGKVLAACLATYFSQASSEFITQADLEEIERRANSSDAAPEDKRNFGLCYYFGLLKRSESTDDFNPTVFIEAAAKQEDKLAIHYWAKMNYGDVSLKKKAIENGSFSHLIDLPKCMTPKQRDADEVVQSRFQRIGFLQSKMQNLLSKAPTVLDEMQKAIKKFDDSFFEVTLCSADLPTDVIKIVQSYYKKLDHRIPLLAAASLGDFFATYQKSSPVPAVKKQQYKDKDDSGCRLM